MRRYAVFTILIATVILIGCEHPSYSDGIRSATNALEDACAEQMAVMADGLRYFEAFPEDWENHYREVVADARRRADNCGYEIDHQRWRAANYERGDEVGPERLPR